MRKRKNLIFYVLMLVVFGGLMYLITQQGEHLESGKLQIVTHTDDTVFEDWSPYSLFQEAFNYNITHLLAIFILQIISIILISRLFGYIFNKIGQPTVIGEIVAGIILGPSVVGFFFPEVS